jgi:hypothetical protein
MSGDIVFVNVRNDHGTAYEWLDPHPGGSASYTDFRALVRLSGFKTCEIGDIEFDSDNTYIFAPNNGYVEAALKSRPRLCKAVHWELERPGTEWFPWFDETWVSDKTQYALANHPRVRYVPLGGHVELGGAPALPKVWDLIHLAYAYGSRAQKLYQLEANGFLLAPATFDPMGRRHTLAHSRWGLMLHQTPHPIMTPLRAVLFACWRLPIVAEEVGDSYPYKFIGFDPELNELRSLSEEVLEEMVEYNYNMITRALPFRTCVESAVDGCAFF